MNFRGMTPLTIGIYTGLVLTVFSFYLLKYMMTS